MSEKESHVLNMLMRRKHTAIVRAEGVYLYDDAGNRILDGIGGVILCNLGHGLDVMADTLRDQAKTASFVYRLDFTTPVLEEAAEKVCAATRAAMEKVFFVSGGSEATEIAVKLARKYHIDNGDPSKYKVISRWISYHGNTMGALAMSGMPMRRADYIPMLGDTPHIAPAYCYRCWYGQEPSSCNLACAQALENEIMCLGPETVAAFIAEPIGGTSLCAAVPHKDYFKRIRQICDRFNVLLIADEVMTGFGRTGKWFGYEHFGIQPDIMAMGKGLGGGYFPIGAAAVSRRIYETIHAASGYFGAGFSWAGNPMGAAVAAKTIDYLRRHDLVARSHAMGLYLDSCLQSLKSHPTVGDIRGRGLLRGIEFVKDKALRTPLDPDLKFSIQLGEEALKRGLYLQSSNGNDRGRAGDMILLGPPYIIERPQIEEMVAIIDAALTVVEQRNHC